MQTPNVDLLRDAIAGWQKKHREETPRSGPLWSDTDMSFSSGIKYDAFRRWIRGGSISGANRAKAEAWAVKWGIYRAGGLTDEGAALVALCGGRQKC